MDAAYDHIAEQTYATADRSSTPKPNDSKSTAAEATPVSSSSAAKPNLQTELQETFKAFSSTTWGAKIGGFWGNVRKQGESYYEEARKEVEDLGADALTWSEGLRKQVVSVGSNVAVGVPVVGRTRSDTVKAADGGDIQEVNAETLESAKGDETAASESKDKALQENETFIERFKTEAAKRLKEVQKAEDAADEALLRFGMNIRSFLKDAISVSAPEAVAGNDANEVLFESKDALTGKKVIHASRFDAQLHVIHTTPTSFTQDPDTEDNEWEEWKKGFDAEKQTDAIAKDLEIYTELRNAMEKLVPEKVEYKDFWMRYYFLRHVVGAQEEKRREMLKASTGDDEEEVGWDDDSEDEAEKAEKKADKTPQIVDQKVNGSTSTLQQPVSTATDTDTLKPKEPRRSHDEKSVADSDASYDLVSGATSRAPGSPKEAKSKIDEESDEEDWE